MSYASDSALQVVCNIKGKNLKWKLLSVDELTKSKPSLSRKLRRRRDVKLGSYAKVNGRLIIIVPDYVASIHPLC